MVIFQIADIEALVASLSLEFPCSSRLVNANHAFLFTFGGKLAELTWDHDVPDEVWIALFSSRERYEGKVAELCMFEEAVSESGKQDVMHHFAALVRRYFKSPTRIRRRWIVFGEQRLQYQTDGVWKDIYTDAQG